jgi:phosphoglycerate dehydrogenase-like enzyme
MTEDASTPAGQRGDVAVSVALGDDLEVAIAEALPAARSVHFLSGMQGEARRAALAAADVLVSWDVTSELAEGDWSQLQRLGLLQLVSAGAEHLPFGLIAPTTLIAANVGAYAKPMAEHALAMILALGKQLVPNHVAMGRGEFPHALMNRELRGTTAAIIGFGGVGRACADLLRPLGIRIAAINRTGLTEEVVDFIGTLADLDSILSTANIVIVALPLTRSTRGLIGRRELALMRPDAILVNLARGHIIEESALFDHLAHHPDILVGLDAWWSESLTAEGFRLDHPFFALPNLLGSPHSSALVPGWLEIGIRMATDNVQRYLKHEPLRGLVTRKDYVW